MMLDIDAERASLEPYWFTVHPAVIVEREEDCRPAVEVRFLPIGRIAMRAARRAAGEVYIGADLPDEEGATLPTELIEAAGDALSECLLMTGIDAWRGVGDRDGNIAPVTSDNLRAFLANPLRFEKLDAEYVRPFILKELEKNGSSPLPSGILAGATPDQDIAETSAKLIASAGANRKGRKRAVRTAKTNRAPKGA